MNKIDFQKHNEEAKAILDSYSKGRPLRVPVKFSMNSRMIILNPEFNKKKITFRDYFESPEVMMDTQLEFQYWLRHEILQDLPMGLPSLDEGWMIYVDFQNCYDASWFGAPVYFAEGQCPDSKPIINGDKKNALFDRGMPDPFKDGILGKNLQFYESWQKKIKDYRFYNIPVKTLIPAGLETDGPFTLAINLRGSELLTDMYEDPQYVKNLLMYLTDAIIMRIKKLREYFGYEARPKSWSTADDSIALISTAMYKEFVLPCHKKLLNELAGEGSHIMHLCGDATRHFRTIRDELNVYSFDTGFPIDFKWLREELGEKVEFRGGPRIDLLLKRTTTEIDSEVKRILSTGIMKGGKFILGEANNVAPCTLAENLNAVYNAAKNYGLYKY